MEIRLHGPGGERHGAVHARVHSIIMGNDGRREPPKNKKKNRSRRYQRHWSSVESSNSQTRSQSLAKCDHAVRIVMSAASLFMNLCCITFDVGKQAILTAIKITKKGVEGSDLTGGPPPTFAHIDVVCVRVPASVPESTTSTDHVTILCGQSNGKNIAHSANLERLRAEIGLKDMKTYQQESGETRAAMGDRFVEKCAPTPQCDLPRTMWR